MPNMEAYETALRKMHSQLKAVGFTHGVFGDIFLEDLRAYRETLLAKEDLQCLFPIWNDDTDKLLQDFFAAGFKAVVVCINSSGLDKTFCGRELNASFIKALPAGVEVCGENGEYHSFVYDGPLFTQPVLFKKGEIVSREYTAPKGADDCFETPRPNAGFFFQDLIPG
jgi:uncharacterized protein (TIGR00290 family)